MTSTSPLVVICRCIAAAPQLFEGDKKLAASLRAALTARLAACGDLAALVALHDRLGDETVFGAALRGMNDKLAAKLLKRVDPHAIADKEGTQKSRDHLHDLAAGRAKPKPRGTNSAEAASMIVACRDLADARVLLERHRALGELAIVAKIKGPQVKQLLARLDPHDALIRRAAAAVQRARLVGLLSGNEQPRAEPATAGGSKEKNKRSGKQTRPEGLSSAAMAAEWDGKDRD